MLWVLVGLSSVELIVVHGLLAWWRPWVAIGTSAVTLAGIIWLVVTIRSFRTLPVLVGADRVLMRVGRIRRMCIPTAAVGGLQQQWTAETIKRRDVLNLALVAYPNVVLDLREPQRLGRRAVQAVAHRLDDPLGFAMAVEALGRRND